MERKFLPMSRGDRRKHEQHQDALNFGDCNNIRVSLRCVAKSFNQVHQSWFFETSLSSAATIVEDEKSNLSWEAHADSYIACILFCLPRGGSELGQELG